MGWIMMDSFSPTFNWVVPRTSTVMWDRSFSHGQKASYWQRWEKIYSITSRDADIALFFDRISNKSSVLRRIMLILQFNVNGSPALVAQLDAPSDWRPGGRGSTPAEVGNILSWRLIWNIFYRHSLPSADSRRAVVSFWRKNVHNTG